MTTVQVVFNLEGDEPEPIGVYMRAEESVVFYRDRGGIHQAPDDCVAVIAVDVPFKWDEVNALHKAWRDHSA